MSNDYRQNIVAHWLRCHTRAFFYALSELVHMPLATLLTLLVIGIAMALPASLYVFLKNTQHVGQYLNGTPTISLFLDNKISTAQRELLLKQLHNNSAIAKLTYISPQQGLQEFKQATHFDGALSALNANPLPGVIVVTPTNSAESPQSLTQLANQLTKFAGVNVAQLDLAWVKRLYYIVTLSKRITFALAILFGFGVILIVGNTIRLTLQRHQQEISVLRLIGAGKGFIRRPFLYRGFLYGLFGGYIAWLLLTIVLLWLNSPAQLLVQSYEKSIKLHSLTIGNGLFMIVLSALLGWLGAWFSLRQYLKSPEAGT